MPKCRSLCCSVRQRSPDQTGTALEFRVLLLPLQQFPCT
ncbi:Uncharacterised protein [Vibrio cholerae]|nr:Uncharacterised protein [Vibrio cholerae]CSD62627.1 Uncharacterised protein [Vibrio cholerae]